VSRGSAGRHTGTERRERCHDPSFLGMPHLTPTGTARVSLSGHGSTCRSSRSLIVLPSEAAASAHQHRGQLQVGWPYLTDGGRLRRPYPVTLPGAAMRVGKRGPRPQVRAAAHVLRRAGDLGAERVGRVPAPPRIVEKGAGSATQSACEKHGGARQAGRHGDLAVPAGTHATTLPKKTLPPCQGQKAAR
jgi:hypothetical protein